MTAAVASAQRATLIRSMPTVFVLIWSTGFIVARYGMPYAPPLTFLSWRYAFSIGAFLAWIAMARAAWPRPGVQWLHLAVTGLLGVLMVDPAPSYDEVSRELGLPRGSIGPLRRRALTRLRALLPEAALLT